jgi:hypothetical protein
LLVLDKKNGLWAGWPVFSFTVFFFFDQKQISNFLFIVGFSNPITLYWLLYFYTLQTQAFIMIVVTFPIISEERLTNLVRSCRSSYFRASVLMAVEKLSNHALGLQRLSRSTVFCFNDPRNDFSISCPARPPAPNQPFPFMGNKTVPHSIAYNEVFLTQ